MVLAYAGLALLALLLLVALLAWRELAKAPPAGGTPFTLPNGLRIQHWQESETAFLFTEIWGAESAYSRGGLLFRPGAVVLDAGANIGMFSLFAAERCGRSGTIVSFEPIPSTHSVLQANAAAAAAASGGALDWRALNVGLSDAPAATHFEHHPHFSVWSTRDKGFAEERLRRIEADIPRALDSNPSWCVKACFPRALAGALASLVLRQKVGLTQRVPVRLVTLSSVIEEQGLAGADIDFLKVDVEGAEVEVLRGIKAQHWPLIQQVALEVENFASRDTVLAVLQAQGFATSHFASERERNPGVESEVRAGRAGLGPWEPLHTLSHTRTHTHTHAPRTRATAGEHGLRH